MIMAEELIKLDQWGDIAKLNNGSGVIMPFVQELFLLECTVAGTGFVKDIEPKAKALTIGDTVALVREAENKYDRLAIRVDNSSGSKLGHVPRKKNEIISRLLDGGKMIYGKVSGIEFSEFSSWITIDIKIYLKDW